MPSPVLTQQEARQNLTSGALSALARFFKTLPEAAREWPKGAWDMVRFPADLILGSPEQRKIDAEYPPGTLKPLPAAIRGEQYSPRSPERTAHEVMDFVNPVANAVFAPKQALRAVSTPLGQSILGALAAAHGAPVPLMAGVIKPRGGQWLTGNLDRGLSRLKMESIPLNPQAYRPETVAQAQAINDWVDGPLRKYIMRDLAAPDDPIRKLAETQPIHSPTFEHQFPGGEVEGHQMGVNPRAKNWEDWADNEVFPLKAKDVKESTIEKYPWVAKLSDDETLWNINSNTINSLGFDHLVDEIANGLQSGEINPESLKSGNFSVEAAVRYVAEKNRKAQEAATKAAEEELKNNLLNTPFKEYDDGFKWVELGDTSDPKAMEACKLIGKHGGWCTQQDWAAEEYGSNGEKLFALLDPSGKPHAQIHVSKQPDEMESEALFEKLYDLADSSDQLSSVYELEGGYSGLRKLVERFPDTPVGRYAQSILSKVGPPRISQIKPMANDWGSQLVRDQLAKDPNYKKKILPKLQDFVKSGEWGGVEDLDNTGLWKNPKTGTFHTVEEAEADPTLMEIYESRNLNPDGTWNGGRYAEGGRVDFDDLDRFLHR